MTMEMSVGYSLGEDFAWDAPISTMVQESIAVYGDDESRMRLIEHFSVTGTSLDAMSLVTSVEIRMAVAEHPLTSLEALARLSHDKDRFVRATAKRAVEELPSRERATLRSMDESRVGKLRARLTA